MNLDQLREDLRTVLESHGFQCPNLDVTIGRPFVVSEMCGDRIVGQHITEKVRLKIDAELRHERFESWVRDNDV